MMLTSALPTLNLFNQFLKQISKPVSFRIVKYAKTHPVFRRYFLVLPGRWFHSLDQRMRRRVRIGTKENRDEKKKLVVIDEETAIKTGANLMSECIIFFIAGLGVMAEVYRNIKNTGAKESLKIEEMRKLIDKKTAIEAMVEKQIATINKLEEILNEQIRLGSSIPSLEEDEEIQP